MGLGPYVRNAIQALPGRPGHNRSVLTRKDRLLESLANPAIQNSLLSRFFWPKGKRRANQPRVAHYARVSSHDQHTLPLQIKTMREYAVRRGWPITFEIKAIGLGALRRPKQEELRAAARHRELDAVLVWRLDRWGRSLPDLVVTLKELAELSIGFVSLSEAFDRTTPTGRALAGMLAVRGVRTGEIAGRHRPGPSPRNNFW